MAAPISKRARVEPPSWMTKQAPVAGGYFMYGNEYLPLEEVGQGNFQKVYRFTDDRELTLNGKTFRTSNVVVKIFRGDVAPDKQKRMTLEQIRAHRQLLEEDIPVPKIIINPTDNLGRFFIVEKMSEKLESGRWGDKSYKELSKADRRILKWAKSIIDGTTDREVVNDFRPDNVMLDREGNPKVVDFSEREQDRDDDARFANGQTDVQWLRDRYIDAWAMGNPKIKAFFKGEPA